MDRALKKHFTDEWRRYFPGAELPIALWYEDEPKGITQAPVAKGHRCLICDLSGVRQGNALSFGADTVGCGGGTRYTGFTQEISPQFDYFLSCGIPGKLEGERYKKSPEIVHRMMEDMAPFHAPARHLVFSPWDLLREKDEPAVVIFFATCDVLAGLFTLVNYDRVDLHGVIAPMGAGCASIVYYPYTELASERPRAVLGMFDVSARPCVGGSELTLAIPWPLFARMVENIEESFLITPSWDKVRDRIRRHLECELQ
ncbi:DUF169 domain-containing protein [Candidatus Fermentibacteria bacterium]|nr:DUF169 domain-containing protein [Candidatus Fermentibacteria bacterium]